ncbi:general secretion pathway protein GspJ [Rhodopseudomonas palustris]|uniref:General secretion pathway protein GspJ n=1 Tax=Rhodopseudomonas palustris TaxID=1076 RepID=A0A323UM61_RHOPL|nr:prepilin-type N-terminal cleavage/methylation domain-containing protein [Rhodopseudomonas palustris]PZA13634.1 general secretion pathway protein GspJ [Rhodopseudomonas palustris]
MMVRCARRSEAGFTLFEALVGVALMGLILAALGAVTAQWLPGWNRGLLRVQRNEQLAVAMDRLSADLAAAEYVAARRNDRTPLFEGDDGAVIFVRPAVGPNTAPGLEFVRVSERSDATGTMLVRMRAPFVLLPIGDLALDRIPFADPVVLLRAPYRLTFAYRAETGGWKSSWRNQGRLPSGVRFSVSDDRNDHGVVMASATRLHADMMAPLSEPPSQDVSPPVGAASGAK